MRWLKNLGPESKSLDEIHEHFQHMLADGRVAFDHAFEALMGRADATRAAEELHRAEERIDEMTAAIRRELVVHGTVHGVATFPDLLVLMSVAKDAERIGDYAQNLLTLAAPEYDLELEEGEDWNAFNRLGERLSELLGEGREVFRSGDEERAESFLNATSLLEEDINAALQAGLASKRGNAATRVLALRHEKRVARHMGNVVSSLVRPIDQLDHLDEPD